MISDDTVQASIGKTVDETSQKYISEKERVSERRDALKQFATSILRSNDYEYQGFMKKSKEETDFDTMDQVVDKEMDNYYKNEQRIKAYDDMLFRGISDEYNKTASRFFDRE